MGYGSEEGVCKDLLPGLAMASEGADQIPVIPKGSINNVFTMWLTAERYG